MHTQLERGTYLMARPSVFLYTLLCTIKSLLSSNHWFCSSVSTFFGGFLRTFFALDSFVLALRLVTAAWLRPLGDLEGGWSGGLADAACAAKIVDMNALVPARKRNSLRIWFFWFFGVSNNI